MPAKVRHYITVARRTDQRKRLGTWSYDPGNWALASYSRARGETPVAAGYVCGYLSFGAFVFLLHHPISLSDSLPILLHSYLDILSTPTIIIMAGIFARRSALRAVTTAQGFRTAPRASRSAQLLGRRLYSNGKNDKGYEDHTSSDLPWYAFF